MSMGTLVAGLFECLINHLIGQYTFVLSAYSLQKTSISLPRQTDMKSQPAYHRSSIGLYIGESVPLQMKLPMYQFYTRHEFAT